MMSLRNYYHPKLIRKFLTSINNTNNISPLSYFGTTTTTTSSVISSSSSDDSDSSSSTTYTKVTTTDSGLTYSQGQYRDKIREYFYFIDHQGFLFLDDARMKNFTSCFKDKKFLHFFYSRVRENSTGRYAADFPYISPCGRELNFIRGDDVPIVFTSIKSDGQEQKLIWGNVEQLSVPLDPSLIYMSVVNGRIYHPYPNKYPFVGLIASKIGIEISNNFIFDKKTNNLPVGFKWNGQEYQLKNDCQQLLANLEEKRKRKN